MSKPRILEIGDHDYFKTQYPDRTTLLWTGHRPPTNFGPEAYVVCSPEVLIREVKAARDRRYDIVVAYATPHSALNPRGWFRSFVHAPLSPWRSLSRSFGPSLLAFQHLDTPLVIVDMLDGFTIHRSNHRLLDKARYYFKRELPVDAWRAFHGSGHRSLPTTRFRSIPRWQSRLAKLRPISIGLWIVATEEGWRRITREEAETALTSPEQLPALDAAKLFAAKTSDIFFAGRTDRNSTVRAAGVKELERLAAAGLAVDLATSRLGKEEYYRRVARAWLTWSPEGLGWDCYRHYETSQFLSVPVINYPTIQRHNPLQDGLHAIYYPPEQDGLYQAVLTALADKERLKRIALAGRRHVLTKHGPAAFCNYVLDSALAGDSQDCR